jgi:regulator of RNase E activity RraA
MENAMESRAMTPALFDALRHITTGTITTMLLNKGIRRCWMTAMGVTSAGIFGDILTMRMVRRGVAALVTDGVVRDEVGVLASALPVWCAGVAAPASVNGLTFIGWQEPIGCGGCAIFPGDIIVADEDGAVVIPQNLVEFVATEGAEHERMEGWIVGEVEKGARLPGLYPMNDETKARYEAWKRKREN